MPVSDVPTNGSVPRYPSPAGEHTPVPSDGAVASDLLVWIDQDLCTGDGICTDHAPDVFVILEDGIAYCAEDGKVFNDPGGSVELAKVPQRLEAAVIASANECPGECIFIEFAEADTGDR
jgi:ferredoxin